MVNELLLQYVDSVWKQVVWCAYWVGLGILSSIGLGTGLHTFLLYLVRLFLHFNFNLVISVFKLYSIIKQESTNRIKCGIMAK